MVAGMLTTGAQAGDGEGQISSWSLARKDLPSMRTISA